MNLTHGLRRQWFLSVLLLAGALPALAAESGRVQITRQEGRLRIEVNGEFFANYEYQGASRPYLYPILLPGQIPMTRSWPMQDAPGEEHDHPHQKSLWFAHGDVSGVDFWSESNKAGKTLQDKLVKVKSGKDAGLIRTANRWVAKDGRVIATDDRTIRIAPRGDERVLDYEITIHASHGAVEFGDTKEGTMGLRLNEAMRLKPNKQNVGKPGGHIVNSQGVRDDATWGKRADWVDYYGPVNGVTVGVAMFDHPQNPRHPTWWHVRDYGLFAANPFGLHEFENQPAGAGKLTLPAGQSLTFRYRIVFHRGDEREARIADQYAEYARETAARK